jgi:hypothetical protein
MFANRQRYDPDPQYEEPTCCTRAVLWTPYIGYPNQLRSSRLLENFTFDPEPGDTNCQVCGCSAPQIEGLTDIPFYENVTIECCPNCFKGVQWALDTVRWQPVEEGLLATIDDEEEEEEHRELAAKDLEMWRKWVKSENALNVIIAATKKKIVECRTTPKRQGGGAGVRYYLFGRKRMGGGGVKRSRTGAAGR